MVKRSTLANIWTGVIAASGLVMLVAYQNCGVQMAKNGGGSSNAVELIAKVDLSNSNGQPNGTSNESFNARVVATGLGGNCQYIIIDANGERFEPAGIDRSLLVEGKLLYVQGILRTDLVSMCQAGRILQIEKAEWIDQTAHSTTEVN
jgi:hypothetical protein